MVLQSVEDENPGFLVEMMSIFCDQGEKIVSQLRESVVDFEKVAEYVHKLKGSCACVGAKRVRFGCIRFLKVYKENDKEGCIAAMVEIRREFDELHLRLKTMLQLEQQIQALDAKQIN
ncbi:histidine-containing phosphotransfer protein 2-like [Carex rostrata]